MAGRRQSRTLFNSEGPIERRHAYQLIDQARRGSIFYRLTISPDRKKEDTRRDLDLWGLTQSSLRELKAYLRRDVEFIAAVHDDHTKNRHVNLLLIVPGRLTRQDFRAFPRFIREQAIREARVQRALLDPMEAQTRLTRRTPPPPPQTISRPPSARSARQRISPYRLKPTCPSCGPQQKLWQRGDWYLICSRCHTEYSPTALGGLALRGGELAL